MKTRTSFISIIVALCMLCTMTVGMTGVSAATEGKVINANTDYSSLPVDSVPDGWSNVGPKTLVLHGPSWGQFYAGTDVPGNTWGDSTLVTNDIWTGKLTMSFAKNQLHGGTGRIYFNYVDDNHYNAMEVNGTTKAVALVEATGAEPVILDSYTEANVNRDFLNLVITKEADGTVTVTESGTELLSAKVDANATGKVGFGFVNGGGYFALSKIEGSVSGGTSEPDPSEKPDPTEEPAPTDDGKVWVEAHSETFDAISDEELAKWGNKGEEEFTIGDGKVTAPSYANDSYLIYDGQTFSGTYKVGVDIAGTATGDGTQAGVVFNYQPTNYQGYRAIINGRTGKVELYKNYQASVWNPILLASAETEFVKTDVRMEVTYGEDGSITVDIIKDGKTTTVISGVKDEETQSGIAPYTSGKAGIFAGYGVLTFDNFSVSNRQEVGAITVNPADAASTRYLGRAYTANGVAEMYYPYSGVEFVVENATKVAVEMKRTWSSNADAATYVGVSVDDSDDYKIIKVASDKAAYYTVATFAQPGTHKVKVIKASGQNFGLVMSNIQVSGSVEADATIAPSQPKSRKIEFVGDSITVGYGLLDEKTTLENATKSYAGLTASYFDADVSMPSVSGCGFAGRDDMILNEYGCVGVSYIYDHTYSWGHTNEANYRWDFSRFTPDIVVVNIGTNGGAANTAQHYIDFVNQIRERNGDTDKSIPIILAQGPMTINAFANIQAAVAELNGKGDTNVYALSLGYTGTGGVDSHPTPAQQQDVADILIPEIEKIMGENWGQDIPATASVTPVSASAAQDTASETATLRFVSKVTGQGVEQFGACVLPTWIFSEEGLDSAKAENIKQTGAVADGGTFAVDITDIPQAQYDNEIYAKPFIVVGGTVIWADSAAQATVTGATNVR